MKRVGHYDLMGLNGCCLKSETKGRERRGIGIMQVLSTTFNNTTNNTITINKRLNCKIISVKFNIMSAFFAHQSSFVRKYSILAEVCLDVKRLF